MMRYIGFFAIKRLHTTGHYYNIDFFIYKFVIYILLSNRAGAIGANALPIGGREVIIGSGGQVYQTVT